MSDRTLLASVVLFRELYDSDKDVYDVISEFIKAALLFASKRVTTSTEVKKLLASEFELSLPEAVVNTTLHRRLYKRDQVLTYSSGQYSVEISKLEGSRALMKELEVLQAKQDALVLKLIGYVTGLRGALSDQDKSALTSSFCHYLFETTEPYRFAEEISAFIVNSTREIGFAESLNAVREGFVLYDGVRHSPDLGQLSSWRNELTIYFDTEHLFDLAGYNGALHKQLIKDLINLASEVRDQGRRQVSFRYFTESADEIDRFFHVAELIVAGRETLDPSKPAMMAIVEGCDRKGDVIAKKASFIAELRANGVVEAPGSVTDFDETYNLESAEVVASVEAELGERGRTIEPAKLQSMFQMLTKVHALRRGLAARSIEEAGHVFVSRSFLSRFLAFHPEIRSGAGMPLAADLETVTNKIWFKLHKGLARGFATPTSLNVLAKAQVVLASQMKSSVSRKFDSIQSDFVAGKLGKPEAESLLNELRSRVSAPEAVDDESLASILDVLDHKGYEHHQRERQTLINRAIDGEAAVAQLDQVRQSIQSKFSLWAGRLSTAAVSVLFFFLSAVAASVVLLLVNTLASPQDTLLSKLSILVALLIEAIALWRVWKVAFGAWRARLKTYFLGKLDASFGPN